MAAAVITAASNTFSRDVSTTPQNKHRGTFSAKRGEIDSTPRMVTKFDTGNRDTRDDSRDSIVFAGSVDTSSSVCTPLPTTPLSAIETGPTSPDSEIYIATYDYKAMTDTELDLHQGDMMVVLEKADNGWWHGLVGESHGWFPESFAEPAPAELLQEYRDKSMYLIPVTSKQPDRSNDKGPRRMSEFVGGTSEEVEASGEWWCALLLCTRHC